MLTRPGILLRLEALAVLASSLLFYSAFAHGRWLWFGIFFLAPDLSLLGYLVPKPAALAPAFYNAIHSYFLPLLLVLAAWTQGSLPLEQASGIWIAHIAFDRLLGFGLKYPWSFRQTHLQAASLEQPAEAAPAIAARIG